MRYCVPAEDLSLLFSKRDCPPQISALTVLDTVSPGRSHLVAVRWSLSHGRCHMVAVTWSLSPCRCHMVAVTCRCHLVALAWSQIMFVEFLIACYFSAGVTAGAVAVAGFIGY